MVIDFHAHVLPEMDHGCTDTACAAAQLRLAAQAGVQRVIATPHFYPQSETVASFLERRALAVKKLEGLSGENFPKVLPAAEVLLCEGMERMEGLELLCIEGTGVLLLEMPFTVWTDGMRRTLDAVRQREELTVVLAHIERYAPQNTAYALEKGYPVQVNSSFCRSLGRRRIVRAFAKRGQLVALGSDIHGVPKRYNDFQRAQRTLGRLGFSMETTERLLGAGMRKERAQKWG